MGIFDFVKAAGQTLGRAITGQNDEADAKDLVKALHDNGVTIEGGTVTVKGSTVSISGQASNQAEREKAVLILGNTQGVEKVDDQMTVAAQAAPPAGAPAPAPAAQSRFYTVKSGDTLSGIAKAMYGDAGRYPEIFEANKPMLKDPDKIYPGQSLRIP